MSDRGQRARSVSFWWLLLLVPAALFAGRMLAGIPAPAPAHTAQTPEPAGAAPEHTAPTPASSPAVDSPGDGIGTPGGGVRWAALSTAMDEAKRTGKPVMLDFNADWCGPCQRMKAEVFGDPAIARAVESAVVPVSVVDRNRENGANPPEVDELQRRYQVEAFPTLIVLSPATGRFEKQEGYGGVDYTREWILRSARSVR